MHYIVLDLEWNQPLSPQSKVFRTVGHRLIFEMIQIGAVKLDAGMKPVDSVSIPIHPTHYVRIHPRIRRMTQLGQEELADAPAFSEAMDQFLDWCGEDPVFLTWGCDDASVWKQNMDFFQYEKPMVPVFDIQRMFSDRLGSKERKGLKAAMELVGVEVDESLFFHNALHDAYYTALVFGKMPNPNEVMNYPVVPKNLLNSRRRAAQTGEREFDSVLAALESPDAQSPKCPQCGKALLVDPPYVQQSGDKYIGLGKCADHGMQLLRLRLRATEEGKCAMTLTVGKATAANCAYVRTKHLQMQQKAARHLELHGALPDLDQALRDADRTSMPFDEL